MVTEISLILPVCFYASASAASPLTPVSLPVAAALSLRAPAAPGDMEAAPHVAKHQPCLHLSKQRSHCLWWDWTNSRPFDPLIDVNPQSNFLKFI